MPAAKGKYKVVVQQPSGGITFDLAEGAYAIEREALDPIGAEIVEVPARTEEETIGLTSVGNVAKSVARRGHAFGLRVIAYDPFLAELEMTAVGVEPVTSLVELCKRADFLSMHAPLNSETHHMMSEKEFKAMKPG